MSDDETQRFVFPCIEEIVNAFEVATDARQLINELATTGHCTGSTLMSLGKSLYDLEMQLVIFGAELETAIALRTDELQNEIASHPDISPYFEYYIVYDSEDRATRKGTIYKMERDPVTGDAIWRDKQP